MFENFYDKLLKLPPEKMGELLGYSFTYLLGGGDKDKAIRKMKELQGKAENDEDYGDLISKEINTGFFSKLHVISDSDSLMELIQASHHLKVNEEEIQKSISNPEILNTYRKYQEEMAIKTFEIVYGLDLSGMSEDKIMEVLSEKLHTSKEKIAQEFGVSKKTLNKWLEILFDDEFNDRLRKRGKKGVYLNEYIQIFEKLFLANEGGKLDIKENIETYLDRINKGVVFSKQEISEICYSDLKTQKENLKKVPFYHLVNKFPYSLAVILIKKMGCEIQNISGQT